MAVIYGVPISPFVRKVMMAHDVKGIEYKLQITVPQSDDADFRAASPLGKIPAYTTDDGFSFADSAVIIAYLERLESPVSLYPQDNNQYAHALWLERYADTQMMSATAALFYQLVIGPKFFNFETVDARVKELNDQLIPAELDYLESQMSDSWLVGETISIADIAVAANLISLFHLDFDLSKWPNTQAYLERLKVSDFFTRQVASEKSALSRA